MGTKFSRLKKIASMLSLRRLDTFTYFILLLFALVKDTSLPTSTAGYVLGKRGENN
jgi:hypothetical protein